MDKDGQYVSITELARMHGVSTETLRHYDRIGLLKPTRREGLGNVRYYSLASQDDKLGTIVALRRLGMSLAEIRDFFEGRNLAKSRELLAERRSVLSLEIEQLQELGKTLDARIASLDEVLEGDYDFENVRLRRLSGRRLAELGQSRTDWDDLYLDSTRLEYELGEQGAAVAELRYAVRFEGNPAEDATCRMGVLLARDAAPQSVYVYECPEGEYACIHRYGPLLDVAPAALQVLDWCEDNGYRVTGDWIETVLVDVAVTDIPDERLYELQVPVERCQPA